MLLNASGCLDALTAPEVARALDGFVTKTITPEPREGNPPVRIAETDAGMLNSIGLANPGREHFLAETLPSLRHLGVPLWVSVGGFSARDYADTCARLDREDVAVLELNLSCPNVDEAPESAATIVAACRAATRLPLYAKLSPSAWDIAEAARAVEAAGADGLSLVNTLRGLALDERTLRPKLGRGRNPDRRHGRGSVGARRTGADRGGRKRRRTRHDSLLRPRRAGSDSLRAGCRGGRPEPRRSPRCMRRCPFVPAKWAFPVWATTRKKAWKRA